MRLLLAFGFSLISLWLCAQKHYTIVDHNSIQLRSDQTQNIHPNKYVVAKYNVNALKSELAQAPEEFDKNRREKETPIYLPMPNGEDKLYMMYESPNMMAGISARYPNIKSYKGYCRSNPSEIVRLSFGPKGIHAAMRTTQGVIYIDPYASDDKEHFISYNVKEHEVNLEERPLGCGSFHETHELVPERELNSFGFNLENAGLREENIPLKIYRLAISCTGEFGSQRINKEDILADLNTSVNRLNMIFENELSIRMMLIDRNDEIIYENPQTDPYPIPNGVGTGGWLLQRNTEIINNTIGSNAYDIGHIYHVGCTDVGGVAYLGSICTGIKGGGVTCHSSPNLEYVTVSIAAHEMGHQLGAPHTFNNCGGNESPGNGFEPGSGSTIMSYAGLCGSNNIQGNNDDYYHGGSLENIYNRTRGQATCGEDIDINNHAPVPNIPIEGGFYIPVSTPFLLTGDATDMDEDDMTYSWEQFNSGPISPLGDPIGNAPEFRVFYPDENKTRIFPRANSILSNSNSRNEVLPTYNRDMRFRFIARDNNSEGGFAAWDQIDFKATDAAGPFVVTYPSSGNEDLTIGQKLEVTWDVANTTASPINCSHVDIYMSYEGELNTDGPSDNLVLLAEKTENDGAAEIIVPNRSTNQARVLIRANNNIFFDISDYYYEAKEPAEAAVYFDVSSSILNACSGQLNIDINTAGLSGYSDDMTLSVEGLPEGATYSFDEETLAAGNNTSLTIDLSNIIETATYQIEVLASADEIETFSRPIIINNIGIDFEDFDYESPANGVKGITQLPTFEWTDAANATSFEIEISTNPSFSEEYLVQRSITSNPNYTPTILLENSTVYYWRVNALNDCANSGYPEVYAFTTESLSCETYGASNLPANISQSGTITILAEIPVSNSGQAADVNIKNIKGTHERNKDLVANLISPNLDTVLLFSKICGNQQNFNCGFDDEAPNVLSCPLNSDLSYVPKESLSVLKGKEINGTWILELKDTKSGNSGKFESIELEICSNLSLDPPILVNNELLEIPPGTRNSIWSEVLLTTDANNSSNEIIYTLISLPEHGQVLLNLEPLSIGDQWTQSAINSGEVKYEHDGSSNDSDQFRFDVIDNEGGWVEITQFNISIDESFTTSTEDLLDDSNVAIYPNPTQEVLHINHGLEGNATLQISDLHGRKVQDINIARTNTLDVSQYTQGVYLFKVSSDTKSIIKRVVIQ